MKVTGWKALRYNWIEYITVICKQEKDMRQSPTKQRHNVFPPPHIDGVPWLRRQFSMKENNTHYLKNIKLHRYGIICLIYLHVQTHLFISKRNSTTVAHFLFSTCIYELLAWLRKPIDTVRGCCCLSLIPLVIEIPTTLRNSQPQKATRLHSYPMLTPIHTHLEIPLKVKKRGLHLKMSKE